MRAVALSVMLSLACGCGGRPLDNLFDDGPGGGFSAREWTRLRALSPLPPVPRDQTNRVRDSAAAAALGHDFFFDTRFSGPATQLNAWGQPGPPARAPAGQPTGLSCASCHDLGRGGADVASVPGNVSVGAGWTDVNALSVVNSVYNQLWFRNGRTDSSWALAVGVAESPTTMNGNRLHTAWLIAEHYRTAYDAVFGPAAWWGRLPPGGSAAVAALTDPATGQCSKSGSVCPFGCRMAASGACWPRFPLAGKPGQPAWEDMDPGDKDAITRVLVNWAKAIDAYEATLISGEAPFDRFVREGPASDAISAAAKRGARLFVAKAACVDCHSGPLLSDGDFHDVGVPQRGPEVPTIGDCPQGAACDCVKGKGCLPWGARDGLDKLAASKYRRDSMWSDFPGDTSRAADVERLAADPMALEGAWRTPSLRNVADTGPYMHDGVYATLAEVVAHYDRGGDAAAVGVRAPQIKPLGLTDQEQADLVAFLATLSAPLANPVTATSPGDDLEIGTPEPAGSNCARGGTRVVGGNDANHDGALQPGEIAGTRYQCKPVFASVAAGCGHTCAILTDGTARCWGDNAYGQLGNGGASPTMISPPVPVLKVDQGDAIAAGCWHTCALARDRTVRCWGQNAQGQLGDPTRAYAPFAVSVPGLSDVTGLAAGTNHTCALLHDESVSCWGAGGVGQLGDGRATDSLVPVPVALTGWVTSIGAGVEHTCASLFDGTVSCWGSDRYCTLGDCVWPPAPPTPQLFAPTPLAVASLDRVVSVAAGGRHTCAVIDDGTVRCWGWSPILGGVPAAGGFLVTVDGLEGATRIAAGGAHTCAVGFGGRVLCWGKNEMGQLGTGDFADRDTPFPVSIPSPIASLAAGDSHTCAVSVDGSAYCWGHNDRGQLGNGATVNSPVPIAVLLP